MAAGFDQELDDNVYAGKSGHPKLHDDANEQVNFLTAQVRGLRDQAAGNDLVEAMTARFQQTPGRSAGVIVSRHPCNLTSSGWTVPAAGVSGQGANADAASTSEYTADVYFGNRSMRLKATGGTAQVFGAKTIGAAVNAADCFVRVTFKPVNNHLASLKLIVANAALTTVGTATIVLGSATLDSLGSAVQTGRWCTIDVPQSFFTGNPNWSSVEFLRVGIVPDGSATEALVHSVELMKRDPLGANPNGMIVLTADDSHISHHTVLKPELDARDLRATLMPIPGAHGTGAQYITDDNVRAMRDAGWDIGAHCFDVSSHGVGYTSMTSAQRVAEFEQIRQWQDSLGVKSRSFSYPLGNHDAATEADVAKYFRAARLALSLATPTTVPETSTPARRYAISGANIALGTAALTAAAAAAHAQKGLLVVMAHALVSPVSDGNSITPTELTATLNAFEASGCDIVTMAEALDRLGM